MPPSQLTVLKNAAKKLWRKRQEAKQKGRRAQAALANTWQEEQKMKEKYKEALAAYEAKAGPSDRDLPMDSSEESCG